MINISPFLNQIVLSKLGIYLSERLSIDNYSLIEAIYILIEDYGEEQLKKDYPDYNQVKIKLEKMNKLAHKSKVFYDTIQDKNFKTKFGDLNKFQKFLNKQLVQVASKTHLIQLDVYKLFVYLVKNSTIQNQTVRAEMLKVLEYQSNMKIDLTKRIFPR